MAGVAGAAQQALVQDQALAAASSRFRAANASWRREYSRRDVEKLAEICALTADGLNLAGIRRVLALQEETRRLQAELARLREIAGEPAAPQARKPCPRPAGA